MTEVQGQILWASQSRQCHWQSTNLPITIHRFFTHFSSLFSVVNKRYSFVKESCIIMVLLVPEPTIPCPYGIAATAYDLPGNDTGPPVHTLQAISEVWLFRVVDAGREDI